MSGNPFSTMPVMEERTFGADRLTIVSPKVESMATLYRDYRLVKMDYFGK